jgi:peptidoglycan/xylan/chitin deacetylase (PgdA/CDA1 family)
MLDWVKQSEDEISQHLGEPTIGFRPPAGVRTPELHWALKELGMPMILWRRRFFDTRFLWKPGRALRSLARTGPGEIVLLHDRQTEARLPAFLGTLKVYIEEARRRGYKFLKLDRESILKRSGSDA